MFCPPITTYTTIILLLMRSLTYGTSYPHLKFRQSLNLGSFHKNLESIDLLNLGNGCFVVTVNHKVLILTRFITVSVF